MKQYSVISGKGGAGKTSVCAALACLQQNQVMIDADVDASNLHLLMHPEQESHFKFPGGKQAIINTELCNSCGKCIDLCRFDAIYIDEKDFKVDAVNCEGCNLCALICEQKAIQLHEPLNSDWYISQTRHGKLFHAELGPGEDLSGKLVARLRTEARDYARKNELGHLLIDGPPGIGCPLIASITGVDKVLIVAEASKSGFHDLIRLVELCKKMQLQFQVLINKADINKEISQQIRRFVISEESEVIGELTYDEVFHRAMEYGKSVIEFAPDCAISAALREVNNRFFDLA